MSNTIHTLEWQGENGMIRLEAEYQAKLQEKVNNFVLLASWKSWNEQV